MKPEFYNGEIDRPSMYRAMLIGSSGEISRLIRLSADDDEGALHLAESLVDGHAVELWDGVRFIEHFPAVSPPR